jgi:hypothetical protein
MLTLLRKFVTFVFGLQAVVLLPILPIAIYILTRTGYHNPHLNVLHFLLGAGAVSLLGGAFTAAWWTIKNSRPSGRWWGMGVSILNILLAIPFVSYVHLASGTFFWLIPISGIVGLSLFLQRPDAAVATSSAKKARSIPGDGTHPLLNLVPWLISAVGGLAGYSWCLRWCFENHVPMSRGLLRYAVVMAVLLFVTLIHEAGHAFAAWSVEMKIRAFLIGPFQFRIKEGQWTFRFDIGTMFSADGAIGAIHTNPHQPVWCDLFMIAAGPLANLGTGLIALCAVFLIDPTAAIQTNGMLFLFGLYSLLACVTNLMPFRTGKQYSDGAKIYQLVSGGPFAELHGALAVVLSTLITSRRPQNFNADLLQRAANGAAQGVQRMVLHMFRYQHYLDCGMDAEAAQAMADAEAVYDEFAAEVPADLLTAFIFGAAYVKRDSGEARRWWLRMEEKKPTKFNADYWLAHSALHWIEGDFYTANTSWYTGAVMAKQLPDVGVYEFDRFKYGLLREVLDESIAHQRMKMDFAEGDSGSLALQTA